MVGVAGVVIFVVLSRGTGYGMIVQSESPSQWSSPCPCVEGSKSTAGLQSS
jgi:hypothetical protein